MKETFQLFPAVILLLLQWGCADSGAVIEPVRDPAGAVWNVTMDHRAVVMAVGQSVKINLIARSYDGTVLETSSHLVQWRSSDSAIVRVDNDGTLHAKKEGGPVTLFADLTDTMFGVTHKLFGSVVVTPTSSSVGNLSIAPFSGTAVDILQSTSIFPSITDSLGNRLFITLPVSITTNRRDIATLSPDLGTFLQVTATDTGSFMVYGNVLIYGISKTDSSRYTVSFSSSVTIYVGEGTPVGMQPRDDISSTGVFPAAPIKIKRGGSVTWYNTTTKPINVTFVDPANVIGGNITSLAGFNLQSRTFPVAGTYAYSNTLNGATGTVVVLP